MLCELNILGYDTNQDFLACIDFRVNPKNFYFSCDINDPETSAFTKDCTAFTNSSCTQLVDQSGYFANNNGTWFYSKSEGKLRPLDLCNGSRKLRKCCGGSEVYDAINIESVLNYVPPIGSVIQIQVTDKNNNTFKSCFEVLPNSAAASSQLTVNNFYKIFQYQKCEECVDDLINTKSINCYLSEGKYIFESCLNSSSVTLEINTSNIFKIGDSVFFNGTCYYATSIKSTQNSLGVVTRKLDNGCDNTLCIPVTPPQPSLTSTYVSGCCDGKLYRLSSNLSYNIGSTISLRQGNSCYRVVSRPNPKVRFKILNDVSGVIVVDGCSDKRCQPCFTPTPGSESRTASECQSTTVLPMGVKCRSDNPTIDNPNGGRLRLEITGGTRPYTVVWLSEDGISYTGDTIFGIPGGNYSVTAFDRYRDNIIRTTCSLEKVRNCSCDGTVEPLVQLSCDGSSNMKGYVYTSAITC